MLQVTADVFSGRPNPVWIIEDEAEARTILRDLVKDRSLLADAPAAQAGLGFRGLLIEPLNDELAHDFDLRGAAYLAAGAQVATSRANELAERLIGLMSKAEPRAAAPFEGSDVLPLEAPLQSFLTTQLERSGRISQVDLGETDRPSEPPPVRDEALRAAPCMIELGAFNPGFWNNNPNVRSRNNCYNYASNKRTDTFAQPGRGCGHMYAAITCAEVTRAALCDGLHHRFHCFPDTEKPRYLVALVVAPGPGFIDYHWYRKQKEGFWGHKPGGTAARNTDNSNRVITNPETCDRGPYTHFCGYFYTCRSQRIR
jgi:hypothetical protein